jgi:hypothetical protein
MFRLSPIRHLLLSLDKRWTPQQRQDYFLDTPNKALEVLTEIAEKSYGDSQLRWGIYFLSKRGDWTGIVVILGNIFRTNEKWLKEIADLSNNGAVF